MKKIMISMMMIVSVFAFGSAFAADSTAARETSDTPYNGVTYFDLGHISRSGTAAATENAMMYNGITYFGERQTGSEAKGYGAGGEQPDSSAKKPYNGVTVLSNKAEIDE